MVDEQALAPKAEEEALPPSQDNQQPDLPKAESQEQDDYGSIGLVPTEEDPDAQRNKSIIADATPTTELELALKSELDRQIKHNELLINEVTKLRRFISKRKQTYKRKRKDESAPRKKLSGYNLFVRERFARLAKENEEALRNADSGAELKRIPPASNIASSGHAWSLLSAEEKARYNEMAKPDEDRFQKETADYTAPEKLNRKRNKTGYNIFFSKHVLELKQHDNGVPSERGSVARVVGEAWKKMSAEEKDEYEKQADRQNEMNPLEEEEEEEREEEDHHYHPPFHPHMNIVNGVVMMPPPPDGMIPPPMAPPPHMPMTEPPPPMNEGGPPPPLGPDHISVPPPADPNMPLHPYPPDYHMHGPHGPPPPVIHQPPGYEAPPYGAAYPPYDPYTYPPNFQGGPPPPPPYPGMPPPPGYGPAPPPNYQGPPPPYV
mmetsp:Transcript_35647/g.75106  ORF Transcript_35647/g.75106 Transcript_35647/m.75106 type:complete len:434 (+) Transcript_35647:449-1750(+)|eukprot:CAMPEP_0183740242 /NCGR_PEP_ID=MMETSP0737-20130205/59060_1 /TAXON_ID=385413 /ORGANISM="Thalassiosira miniscula, Strain CCMP1093" /LENGTH=433 /DNA_ID=CAMNT_0025975245 /DNA_START=413 /DNA_END=1714 /DNA_ORIENTATION=+